MQTFKNGGEFLNYLNREYAKRHEKYEQLYWVSYMGEHSVDDKFKLASTARDAFRADRKLAAATAVFIKDKRTSKALSDRLKIWQKFFLLYQIPEQIVPLKEKIDSIQNQVLERRAKRKEGYRDPHTKKFVVASENKMRAMMASHPDEAVRQACFDAAQQLAPQFIPEYIESVNLMNKYARELGFPDFYAYKIRLEEGISKAELFRHWDEIYAATKFGFKNLAQKERQIKGLRKPWNFTYLLAGDFIKEEDKYFQFDQAVERWGRSFAALGINYRGGHLKLDLIDRPGKWNNGFCHYPKIAYKNRDKFVAGAANFTSNAVFGQAGAGLRATETLFHEGGHAADRLNCEAPEIILGTEYPPASTGWAETQSMFLDRVFSSVEWRMRYAKDAEGSGYPFELFQRRVEKLNFLAPLGLMSVMMVCYFEKEIYECKNLTEEKVLQIARRNYRKFSGHSIDSLALLNVPHIYKWESACAYHGYGLAELGLAQWRAYFYKKYGYIVDNPNVGREMAKIWRLGSTRSFAGFVKLATGKKLSSKDYIESITRDVEKTLLVARTRIARTEKVSRFSRKINLNAKIEMVDGKKVIATNRISFEDMAKKYAIWVRNLL